MSRCFPYPPPGFEIKNGGRDKVLIESIKLEREKEKAKKENRKEKKRVKKEKKRIEKDGNHEIEKKKHSKEKRQKDEKIKVDLKKQLSQKRRADEKTEQLEKSGVTDEHEQPSNYLNNSDSSDCTQNSNKRKRQITPSDSIYNHGSVIRIRLPLLKHKDPSVITDTITQDRLGLTPNFGRSSIVSEERCVTATIPIKEHSCSISGRPSLVLAQQNPETGVRSRFESRALKLESQYSDLFKNLARPSMQIECAGFDDLDWLFDKKQHYNREAKRCKTSDDNAVSFGGSSRYPQACYLREVDTYCLPYTVPF